MPRTRPVTGLAALAESIDRQFGLICRLSEHRLLPNDFPVHIFSATLSDTRVFSPGRAGPHCGGAGVSRDVARLSALGEALERYCLGLCDQSSWVTCSASDLGESACDLTRLASIPAAFPDGSTRPYVALTPDRVIDWVPAKRLVDNKVAYVPANLVYVPFIPTNSIFIDRPISTGSALAMSAAVAAEVGLYEVIERDAFMLWWLARLAAPPVEREVLRSMAACSILEAAGAAKAEVTVLHLGCEFGVNVVVAICRSRDRKSGPSLSIGAAARPSLEVAAEKALVEMAHGRAWQNAMLCAQGEAPGPTMGLEHISDHPLLWADNFRSERLWFEGEVSAASSAPALGPEDRGFAKAVEVMTSKGLEPVAVDLTSEDVRALGVSVRKVIVPGLHPLEVGHDIHLSSARLRGALRLAEGSSLGEVFDRLNPLPHPFP